MKTDQFGMDLTAASDAAAQQYDTTLMAYLGLRKETGDQLRDLFAADPEMPMAFLMRGNFMKLFCKPGLDRKAKESLDGADAAIAKHGASPRERLHREALASWCRGDMRGAIRAWEAILLDWPHDMLAMRLAHFMHFYMGDSQGMRDSILRVLPHWSRGMPAYGFVVGYKAFGLEEAGDYAAAEAAGREAVEINPRDIWATHAVAHVMEMQGRHAEGVRWLDGFSANWGECNNFAYHAWWHKALFHLERDEYDMALQLYDTRIRADQSDDYLDMSNAIAMLTRFEQHGIDVGDRWSELADKCEPKVDDHIFVFHDMHYLMALAAGGRDAKVELLLSSMREAAARTDTTEGPIFARVGLPLAEAIVAIRKGDHAKAVALAEPIRREIVRIGGSHAQRDVFSRMIIDAALQAGQSRLARALLAERTALNPNNVWGWRRTADAMMQLGDASGAARARAEAKVRLAA